MKYKYATFPEYKPGPGRKPNPDKWCTGPDPLTREKYYAYSKHKAQAKYRKEEYDLTWEDWQSMWTDELFLKRGRGREDLCMQKINPDDAWSLYNVEIVTRIEHLQRASEYRDRS